jgi:hypothetical protein
MCPQRGRNTHQPVLCPPTPTRGAATDVNDVDRRAGAPAGRIISPPAAEILAASLLGSSSTRLGGTQIAHARRTAEMVRFDERAVSVALLHDVIALGFIGIDELQAATADPETTAVVDRLTRRDGEYEKVYLTRCAAHPTALSVKRAELIDELTAADWDLPGRELERFRRQTSAHLELLNFLDSQPGSAGSM